MRIEKEHGNLCGGWGGGVELRLHPSLGGRERNSPVQKSTPQRLRKPPTQCIHCTTLSILPLHHHIIHEEQKKPIPPSDMPHPIHQ